MRSLKGCSDFTSRWWMPLPSISPLFMLLFCSCVLCPTEQFSSSYLVKEEFSVKFSPFLAPRLLFNKQHKHCTRTLSVCSSVTQLILIFKEPAAVQVLKTWKNQTTVCPSWCFLWRGGGGGERESESKNRQLRLFQKHQRTDSFHERTGKEPVIRRATFL